MCYTQPPRRTCTTYIMTRRFTTDRPKPRFCALSACACVCTYIQHTKLITCRRIHNIFVLIYAVGQRRARADTTDSDFSVPARDNNTPPRRGAHARTKFMNFPAYEPSVRRPHDIYFVCVFMCTLEINFPLRRPTRRRRVVRLCLSCTY